MNIFQMLQGPSPHVARFNAYMVTSVLRAGGLAMHPIDSHEAFGGTFSGILAEHVAITGVHETAGAV